MYRKERIMRVNPWLRWVFRRTILSSWRYWFFALKLPWDSIKKPTFERIDARLLQRFIEFGSDSYRTYRIGRERTIDVYSTFVVYDIGGFTFLRKIRVYPWNINRELRERLSVWSLVRLVAVVESRVSYSRLGLVTHGLELVTTVHQEPNCGMPALLRECGLLT